VFDPCQHEGIACLSIRAARSSGKVRFLTRWYKPYAPAQATQGSIFQQPVHLDRHGLPWRAPALYIELQLCWETQLNCVALEHPGRSHWEVIPPRRRPRTGSRGCVEKRPPSTQCRQSHPEEPPAKKMMGLGGRRTRYPAYEKIEIIRLLEQSHLSVCEIQDLHGASRYASTPPHQSRGGDRSAPPPRSRQYA